jgi:outer membrane protein assembly factor BamB
MQTRLVFLRRYNTIMMLLAASLLLTPAAGGADWPRFRGPNGQGISHTENIPIKWSEQDYEWKIELPGAGHSSPVVWADRVFVTCAETRQAKGFLLCVSASSGTVLWQREFQFDKYSMNRLNSYATATPALDAGRVYVLWPGAEETSLSALTHEGTDVWTVKLAGVHSRHGLGSSPIVCGDVVVIAHEQDENNDDVPSEWIAVDGSSGEIRWRYQHSRNADASYSTPCLYPGAGEQSVLVFTSNLHGIAGVHPQTGRLLWQTPGALPARVVSSPVLLDGAIAGTCGQGGRGVRLAVVEPMRSEDSYEPRELYGRKSRTVPYVPTSVVHDGLLFTFHDGGVVSCLRGESGEVLWSEKPAGRFFGSPVCVNGILYCITTDGEVVVLEASAAYRLLAVNSMGEKSHATPAVAAARMYLRSLTHLMCIGAPSK